MTPERWQLIEGLYQFASDLPAGDRLTYLEHACRADPSLKAEVLALLNASGLVESVLDTPAIHLVAQSIASDESSVVGSYAPGTMLSHYRIQDAIGHGGMGVVYKAEDVRLERFVALKVLPNLLARDDEALRRFEREARAASALNHPNICTVYEIDRAGDQRFIAIELLEGESLRDRIARGPFDASEIMRIGIDVCAALEAAHAGGIIHRDIKPANIFLTTRGLTKVLDFGAAKRMSSSLIDAPADPGVSTAHSTSIGTLAYMSPEQAAGEQVDSRSDIYSLGAVLYEMVTGLTYVEALGTPGDSQVSGADDPWLPADFNPVISTAFSRIIDKALQKKRADRYQQISEVRTELLTLQRRAAAKSQWWRASLAALVLLPILAVAFAIAARDTRVRQWIFGVGTSELTRNLNSLAVLPFKNLNGDIAQDYFAEGMTNALVTDLTRIGTLHVISSNSSMQYKDTRKPISEIARELHVNAIVEGTVLRSGDRVRVSAQLVDAADDRNLWGGNYDRDSHDILKLQSELARAVALEIVGTLSPQEQAHLSARAQTVSPEAYEAFLRGEYFSHKEDDEGFAKAEQYYRKSISVDPAFASAYTGLAELYGFQAYIGRLPPTAWLSAEYLLGKALELDPDSSLAHMISGMIKLQFHCDHTGAERELNRAIELNPGDMHALNYHSYYLLEVGRSEEAIAEKTRVLQSDPVSVETSSELGMYYIRAGRNDEAIRQLHEALELDSNYPRALIFLGWAYANEQQYDEAVVQLQKSVSLERSPAGLGNLGYAYARWGKTHEAHAAIRQLSEMAGLRYVPPFLIARIHAALGERDEALRWLSKARKGERQLAAEPGFDSLRGDSEFQAIEARLNPGAGCPKF